MSLMLSIRKNTGSALQRGFTLTELLVVVAIIGLLASAVLARLDTVREQALKTKAFTDIRALHEAVVKYYLATNQWPPNCDNIDTLAEWQSGWAVGYYPGIIGLDPWDRPYFFDGCPNEIWEPIDCGTGMLAICSSGPDQVHTSFNRSDMTVQNDDICIYMEPTC